MASISKERLLELSDQISEQLIKNGYTTDDVDSLSANQLYKVSPETSRLFDVDYSIYDAFHEEETLSYFRSLLKFDVAFKLRSKK